AGAVRRDERRGADQGRAARRRALDRARDGGNQGTQLRDLAAGARLDQRPGGIRGDAEGRLGRADRGGRQAAGAAPRRQASRSGCSGRIKREAGGNIEDGDTLTSTPLKISVEAVQPGPGTQPELATLLASELRAALDGMPQFQLANDPQLTATGRVSGPRGR